MKPRVLGILLAFFFGGIGIQFFYINKPVKGIMSVIFCWTFIPTFIALYHIVKWLIMDDKAWEKAYKA